MKMLSPLERRRIPSERLPSRSGEAAIAESIALPVVSIGSQCWSPGRGDEGGGGWGGGGGGGGGARRGVPRFDQACSFKHGFFFLIPRISNSFLSLRDEVEESLGVCLYHVLVQNMV